MWREWKLKEVNLRNIRDELYTSFGYDEVYKIQVEGVKFLSDAGLTREDMGKAVAFHVLIGSTPPYDFCERFDFDGDLSIKKFFSDKLEKKIKYSKHFFNEEDLKIE